MANVKELSDADFDAEVLASNQPVLVDFWAPWCGPCRMLAPVVEQLAVENAGTVKVVKINTDDNREVASNRGVSALPTLMVFKDGQEVERFVGVQSKQRIQSALDQAKA